MYGQIGLPLPGAGDRSQAVTRRPQF